MKSLEEWEKTDLALKNKVIIINYGSGNVKSIGNMLNYLGCDYKISNNKNEILSASKLIFPGQGHFKQAIENLENSGLIETIKTSIGKGTSFLGICLGLQILFEKSEEAPEINGLGIFQGEVKKFDTSFGLKIPQIGWNKIKTTSNNSFLNDGYFYFANSYYIKPKDESIISSKTDYGINFASSIEKNNVIGVQFHPEKSSNEGIAFMKKWVEN